MTEAYIPERFRRAITLHIAKNLLHLPAYRPPLILGIHGPSGVGKTFQCEVILEQLGVTQFLISGGQFESGTAGNPAKLVRETYCKASDCLIRKPGTGAAIVINDIDTGLGNWGANVQTTINTQTVYGELMHIVDYPNQVEGRSTRRVPIIITGNDFTKLYEPLLRAGRMTAFEWAPNSAEKGRIVARIFPELCDEEVEALILEFGDQPIAFFSSLKSALVDDLLWETLKNLCLSDTIPFIRTRSPEFRHAVSLEKLVYSGHCMIESSQLTNHLRQQP